MFPSHRRGGGAMQALGRGTSLAKRCLAQHDVNTLGDVLASRFLTHGAALPVAERISCKDMVLCVNALGERLSDPLLLKDIQTHASRVLARTKWGSEPWVSGMAHLLKTFAEQAVAPHFLWQQQHGDSESLPNLSAQKQCVLFLAIAEAFQVSLQSGESVTLPRYFGQLCRVLRTMMVVDRKSHATGGLAQVEDVGKIQPRLILNEHLGKLIVTATACRRAVAGRGAHDQALVQDLGRLRYEGLRLFVLRADEQGPSGLLAVLQCKDAATKGKRSEGADSALFAALRKAEERLAKLGSDEPRTHLGSRVPSRTVMALELLERAQKFNKPPAEATLARVTDNIVGLVSFRTTGSAADAALYPQRQELASLALQRVTDLAAKGLIAHSSLSALVTRLDGYIRYRGLAAANFDDAGLVQLLYCHAMEWKLTRRKQDKAERCDICRTILMHLGSPLVAMYLSAARVSTVLWAVATMRLHREGADSVAVPLRLLHSMCCSHGFLAQCDSTSAARLAWSVVTINHPLTKRILTRLHAARLANPATPADFLFASSLVSDDITVLWALAKEGILGTIPVPAPTATLLRNAAAKAIRTKCPGDQIPKLLGTFSSLRCTDLPMLRSVGTYLSREVGVQSMSSNHLAMSCRSFISISKWLSTMPFFNEVVSRVIADAAGQKYKPAVACQLLFALSFLEKNLRYTERHQVIDALVVLLDPGVASLTPTETDIAVMSFARLRAKPLVSPALLARLGAVAKAIPGEKKRKTRDFLISKNIPVPAPLEHVP